MFDTLTTLAKRVFGDANERELKRIDPLVQRNNALEPAMKALDDAALRGRTAELKEKLAAGATLSDAAAPPPTTA